MTQSCCPACRLRVPRAVASGLPACPSCGEPLCVIPASDAVGLALYSPSRPPAPADVAIAVARITAHDRRP